MAAYRIARYEVRSEARARAERAMHDYAAYVRKELPDLSWTTYRDPRAPTHYVSVIRVENPAGEEQQRNATGTRAYIAALEPMLVGAIEITECELVTSSDLQRRHRR